MKNILLILIMILVSTVTGLAQVSYEGKLDASMKVIQLNDGSLKFYKIDSKEKKLLIFNADNSLWKSIELLIPKGHLIDDITFINGATVEKEQQFKVLFTCYYQRTYPTEDVSEFFSKQIFTVNVIDEKGNFLLKIHNVGDYKLLSANGNNKLLVYKKDNDGFKSKRHLEVYGFNGQDE